VGQGSMTSKKGTAEKEIKKRLQGQYAKYSKSQTGTKGENVGRGRKKRKVGNKRGGGRTKRREKNKRGGKKNATWRRKEDVLRKH